MDELLPRARKMAASAAPGTPPSERVGCFSRWFSMSCSFSIVKLINNLIIPVTTTLQIKIFLHLIYHNLTQAISKKKDRPISHNT